MGHHSHGLGSLSNAGFISSAVPTSQNLQATRCVQWRCLAEVETSRTLRRSWARDRRRSCQHDVLCRWAQEANQSREKASRTLWKRALSLEPSISSSSTAQQPSSNLDLRRPGDSCPTSLNCSHWPGGTRPPPQGGPLRYLAAVSRQHVVEVVPNLSPAERVLHCMIWSVLIWYDMLCHGVI